MANMLLFRFFIKAGSVVAIMLTLLIFCTTLAGQSYNQRLVIADLKSELSNTINIAKRTSIINDICLYYQVREYQTDSVFFYANILLDIGTANNYPTASILGHRFLGSQYTRINQFDIAKIHLHKSLKLSDTHNYYKYIHDTYNPLAKNCYQQNQLDSALYYFTKCIDLTPEDLHSKITYFHTGLSAVYNQLGQLKKQKEHLHKALEEAESGGIKLDQIIALTGLLDYYSLTKNDALEFNKFKKSYDVLISSYDNFMDSYHSNFILHDSMPYPGKVIFLNTSLAENKKDKYIEGVYYNYIQLQKSHLDNENYQAASNISEDALAYYQTPNAVRLNLLVELYRNKWLAESKLDNPNKAIATVQEYNHLKDSLVEMNNSKHINELNIKYESAKKDAQLAEVAINVNKRTSQRNYAFLFSGLLLTLGYYFWRRSRYKQMEIETKNKLQAERITNLENEKKILSLASTLEGQEAERKRIAQDLHDGLGGLLSSVRNHFSLIQDEVIKLDKLNIYDRTNSMIDQACTEVRRISHNLMPAGLQLNGLVDTLSQYCHDIETANNLDVQFEHNDLDGIEIDDSKEIFIYRIIQEAITNVTKHADASNLLVQLALYENEITLIIEDDGKGFDSSILMEGIGLKSIQSRVDHLKGHLDINSVLNTGTTITINIPHESNQNKCSHHR